MSVFITATTNVSVPQVVVSGQCLADCEWKKKGITVGEGEVVGFIVPKKKVGICENGRITYKLEKEVKKGYKLACNGEMNLF